MNVGDWVFFKTRNWSGDLRRINPEHDTAKMKDVSGQLPYTGRGKVVGVAGKNYMVREEKIDRPIEVGPHPDEEIHPLGYDLPTLTLG